MDKIPLLAECQTALLSFLDLAWYVIAVSALAGLLYIFADLMARVGGLKVVRHAEGGGAAPEVIKAAVDLVQALIKAPPWFALFVGGLALFWLSSDVPGLCSLEKRPQVAAAPQTGGSAHSEKPKRNEPSGNANSEAGGSG